MKNENSDNVCAPTTDVLYQGGSNQEREEYHTVPLPQKAVRLSPMTSSHTYQDHFACDCFILFSLFVAVCLDVCMQKKNMSKENTNNGSISFSVYFFRRQHIQFDNEKNLCMWQPLYKQKTSATWTCSLQHGDVYHSFFKLVDKIKD